MNKKNVKNSIFVEKTFIRHTVFILDNIIHVVPELLDVHGSQVWTNEYTMGDEDHIKIYTTRIISTQYKINIRFSDAANTNVRYIKLYNFPFHYINGKIYMVDDNKLTEISPPRGRNGWTAQSNEQT